MVNEVRESDVEIDLESTDDESRPVDSKTKSDSAVCGTRSTV